MKPICVPCRRFYRPKKTGYRFVEGMPLGSHARPGLDDAHLWKPYKLWMGDLWECQGCGHQIVSGVAGLPLAEHYQPDFTSKVERAGADPFQVNDC